MKNNSFSLESTANPLFFVDYMKSQVKRPNAREKHGLPQFRNSYIKDFKQLFTVQNVPSRRCENDKKCGIRLGFISNTFPLLPELRP